MTWGTVLLIYIVGVIITLLFLRFSANLDIDDGLNEFIEESSSDTSVSKETIILFSIFWGGIFWPVLFFNCVKDYIVLFASRK